MEREILGLSQPVVIDSPGTYELPPINQGKYYRINTSTEDEYFLIEYRKNSAWDAYIGGEGVLVYHVDKSKNNAGYSFIFEKDVPAYYRWASQVDINTLAEHQCADLIEADGRTDKFSNYTDPSYRNLQKSLQGIFSPGSKGNSLTPLSSPGLDCWDDTAVAFALTDIVVKNGSASFNVIPFLSADFPTPINIAKDVFQDGAIVTFESSFDFSGTAKVQYGPSGSNDMKTVVAEAYQPGRWAVEISGLQPSTSYSFYIAFTHDGAVGESVKNSFMTKKRDSSGLPRIYLPEEGRNADGAFQSGAKLPLKVFNLTGVENIQWRFDGSVITPAKDLYYKVAGSGTLEAHVSLSDGTEEILIKEIRISDK
jgi:hypothetical protein